MMSFRAAVLLALVVAPAAAFGQHGFEGVGGRALGMAGAFVAVADDASAVFWNPAGLATGQPFGVTAEWTRLQFGNQRAKPVAGPATGSATFTSLGTWPLGVSYGRQRSSWLVTGPDGQPWARTVETRQFGVTVLQTIVPGLVVGSTLKYLRGGVAFGPAEGLDARAALEQADRRDRPSRGAFDLDLGLMADLHPVRVGLTVKNVATPRIGVSGETAITVSRHARIGVAVLPVTGLTLAMDVDLNTVDLRGDRRRMVALGTEQRLGSRLAVRGGLRWDLEGPPRPIGSLGASVAVRSGLWVDGHFSRGRPEGDRAFGVALRAGY